MKRRDFLITLGATATGALAGWIIPFEKPKIKATTKALPIIRRGISLHGNELFRGEEKIAHLDHLGIKICKLLNGKNNIPDIAKKLFPSTNINEAEIAAFCCVLDDAHFFENPLNIQLYRNEYQS